MHQILRSAARCILLTILFTVLGAPAVRSGPPGDAVVPSPELPLDQLVARHFTTRDGLPSNVLNRVQTSADGYLWVSTYSGLVRFDGQAFTIWGQREFPGLSTNGFLGLGRDRSGRLWVGTQGDGPWWYDGQGLRPQDPERRLSREVMCMLVDRQGNLWVGLEDSGVYRYRGTEPMLIEHPSLIDVPVRDLHEDRSGALYFATRGKGVTRLAGGEFRTFSRIDGLHANEATSLEEGAEGTLWVGQRGGLARIDGENVKSFPELDGAVINDLLYDRYGSLWMATDQGLLRKRAQGGALETLTEAAGAELGILTAVIFDHEGSLWLTSSTRGLFQLRQGKFTNYSTKNGLVADRVHAVRETNPGEFLVGTDGGGLHRIRQGRIALLPLPRSLRSTQVMDIHQDRAQRLWISTYDGLLRLDGERERLFTQADGLPDLFTRWTHEDRQGRLWVGTVQGVARRQEDGRFALAEELGPAAQGLSFSVAESEDGRLFFGTRSGLLVYGPRDDVKLYRAGEDLPGSLVFSARIDAEGTVWICTNGGLARLNERGITSLAWRAGLPAESIFDLREDDAGAVWMNSAVGVIRLAKSELKAYLDGKLSRVEADLFDDRDGMLHAECTGARKILKAQDGRLWFPTLGGVTVVDPAHLHRNPIAPPVLITGFTADGQQMILGGEPTVPPGHRRLVFDFKALSYRAPSKVRVRTRLEGFDPNWVDMGPERQISYTNLAPGPYALRVLAANDDGVWNELGAEVRFRIAPFFHQTPWFAALLAALSLTTVVSLYRFRVRAIRQRNALLEEDARERTGLIEELAAKNRELELFAYTASHDLKSPLITIEGFLGLVEEDVLAGDLERMQADMGRVRRGIQTMGRLLDGLLEVSRIGRKDEAPSKVELRQLAHKAVEVCNAQITACGAEVIIAPDLPRVMGSPSRLLQVFQNLVANATKFMGDQANPRIEIDSRLDRTDRVIFVKDNGIGIDPKFHERVFDLFDRLNPKQEGNGLGLAIVKRVVEVHGGKVWVESKGIGHGAAFCFTLDPARVL